MAVRRINSRRKGKVGELEAAQVLRELFGWNARRSQQHAGTESSADLYVEETPDLWWEVKRQQRLNVPQTVQIAVEQAGRKCPVLLHRQDRSPVGWLLTLRLGDLARVLHAYESSQCSRSPPESVATQTLPRQDSGHDSHRQAQRGHARVVDNGGQKSGHQHLPEQQPAPNDGYVAGGIQPSNPGRVSGSY